MTAVIAAQTRVVGMVRGREIDASASVTSRGRTPQRGDSR